MPTPRARAARSSSSHLASSAIRRRVGEDIGRDHPLGQVVDLFDAAAAGDGDGPVQARRRRADFAVAAAPAVRRPSRTGAGTKVARREGRRAHGPRRAPRRDTPAPTSRWRRLLHPPSHERVQLGGNQCGGVTDVLEQRDARRRRACRDGRCCTDPSRENAGMYCARATTLIGSSWRDVQSLDHLRRAAMPGLAGRRSAKPCAVSAMRFASSAESSTVTYGASRQQVADLAELAVGRVDEGASGRELLVGDDLGDRRAPAPRMCRPGPARRPTRRAAGCGTTRPSPRGSCPATRRRSGGRSNGRARVRWHRLAQNFGSMAATVSHLPSRSR